MRTHVQILGVLNIAWGALGLFASLIIMLVFGGVMGIIGPAAAHEPDAHMAIPIVGLVGGLIFLILVITSVPSLVIGIGLLRRAWWARVAGIVLSAVHLPNIPFGTALGIYGLWVLLSQDTLPLFSEARSPVRI